MPTPPPQTVLVLDAMGVIYSVGDDVADLLCPFIRERGGQTDRPRIESLYREASLGRMTADDFWRAVGLDPALEDEYLLRHQLAPGLTEFLAAPPPRVSGIWCLSNDIAAWARKLRDRFALTAAIRGFVISGDVGARKPDPAIYRSLLAQAGVEPHQAVFVDDRPSNLDAAAALGMGTVFFTPAGNGQAAPGHRAVTGFGQLRDLLS